MPVASNAGSDQTMSVARKGKQRKDEAGSRRAGADESTPICRRGRQKKGRAMKQKLETQHNPFCCPVCHKEYQNGHGLTIHLSKKHNVHGKHFERATTHKLRCSNSKRQGVEFSRRGGKHNAHGNVNDGKELNSEGNVANENDRADTYHVDVNREDGSLPYCIEDLSKKRSFVSDENVVEEGGDFSMGEKAKRVVEEGGDFSMGEETRPWSGLSAKMNVEVGEGHCAEDEMEAETFVSQRNQEKREQNIRQGKKQTVQNGQVLVDDWFIDLSQDEEEQGTNGPSHVNSMEEEMNIGRDCHDRTTTPLSAESVEIVAYNDVHIAMIGQVNRHTAAVDNFHGHMLMIRGREEEMNIGRPPVVEDSVMNIIDDCSFDDINPDLYDISEKW
ncbi:hypothetical protein CBR_g55784 [Chara braunii]|uniref:C2H2-type domain-containing protein n=1 Tax=Chara braunii TaxID=69332 RepID=A0A388MD77_CHABU|nr:hypothetical protein CBR_g55784 [Chara braunii]|eukprot:GBG92511.1 hypothetical protein CBR_g55784 [Chara braunii]